MNRPGKEDTQFLKIQKDHAEEFLKLIKIKFSDVNIIDKRKKVLHSGSYVLFPLIKNRENVNKFIESDIFDLKFEIINTNGELDPNYKFRSIEEALADELPEDIIELIPKSYDVIGKIAIIEFDQFIALNIDKTSLYKKKVAEAIVKVNKGVETVYEKKSEVKGKYRLKDLQSIFGEDNPETIYKENNCMFKLDVKNTYFTPRLVFERKRLSLLNFAKNELIVDMFAGVGPISIQIAKSNEVNVYSFDINPMAYKYLIENVKLNKLKGEISAHNIDVATLINLSNELGTHLNDCVDRIIMNLPEQSIKYIDIACFLMKKIGGILHIYQFCEKPNPIEKGIENLRNKLNGKGWRLEEIINSKIVKAFSPKSDLIVIDAKIRYIP
ncbi:MAG: class I SAM-dependent methyltransferase family protein [Candidatus Lokiarchaeota archaeon]|nr:class I SAM-dependent methyltransferase family protein [Candidatus Lokiarchaeota archaeon]